MNSEKSCTDNTQDWIDYILDNVYKYYNKRKIVLWGKYEVSDEIIKRLENKYNVKTSFYVDNDITKIDNVHVYMPEKCWGRANQYYIVVPLGFYQSLKDDLIQNGYRKDLDYFYFSDCVVQNTDDYYEDTHGNQIIGNHKNIKFCFSGFNSIIKIGQDTYFHNCTISVNNASKITIGDKSNIEGSIFNVGNACNVEFNQECKIFDLSLICSSGSSFKVGCNGTFFKGAIYVVGNSLLNIGKNFIIEPGYIWKLSPYTECLVGKDCMFSYDLYLRTNDGHSIFDLKTKENINSTYEISKKRKIVIGNHVWIGMHSTILYNTEIGDGSIIGAASLIKGKIPNNCIAAGIPAKVTRTDIAWCFDDMENNLTSCGENYIHFTNNEMFSEAGE